MNNAKITIPAMPELLELEMNNIPHEQCWNSVLWLMDNYINYNDMKFLRNFRKKYRVQLTMQPRQNQFQDCKEAHAFFCKALSSFHLFWLLFERYSPAAQKFSLDLKLKKKELVTKNNFASAKKKKINYFPLKMSSWKVSNKSKTV